MKRYLLNVVTTLTLLSFMVFSFYWYALPANAAPVRAQATKGSNFTFASSVTTLAFGSPLTNPSLIICSAEYDSGAANSGNTPTDTALNTYTRVTSVNVAGTFEHEVWYALNTHTTASNQVTLTDTNAGVDSTAVCEEWTGANTTSPIDTSITDSNASGGSAFYMRTVAFNLANPSEVVYVTAAIPHANTPISLANNFTNLTSTSTAFTDIAEASQSVATPVGSQQGALNSAVAGSWAMIAVAIKPSTANTKTLTRFTSSGTWTAPAGVTSVDVDAWGSGGGGGPNTGTAGGGAGAYSGLTGFTVTPGNVYTITVGAGGASATNGASSTFSASSTLLAAQGLGATTTTALGTGGTVANSTGTTKHSGGDGGSGTATKGGGTGGGAGGTTANGTAGANNANNCIAQAGGSGGTTGSGNGGGTQTTGGAFGAGTKLGAGAPGGGGGGGRSGTTCTGSNAGAAGSAGEVDITYTTPAPTASRNDDSGWWYLMSFKDELQLV